jgi:hypothetical protein
MLKSLAVIAVAVLGTALVPGSLEAQDVRYTEVTSEFAGAFGRMMKVKQVTFMRVKSEVTHGDTAPLAESVFAILAGYTERESMFPVLPAR